MDIIKEYIFNFIKTTNNIKIPFFQREYTWTKEEVIKLLEDVYESNSKNYYLGSIVLKNSGSKKMIIDGQQRVTTLCLVLKSLNILQIENIDDEINNVLYFLKNNFKYESSNIKDGSSLQEILKSDNISNLSDKAKKTNYYVNLKVIIKWLKDKEDINEVFNKLQKITFSKVTIDDEVDEHILFSQINSTGKPLTAFDLVKNHLFQCISEYYTDDLDNHIEIFLRKWNEQIDFMSNNQKSKNKNLDNYIRQYLAFETRTLESKNDVHKLFKKFQEISNKYKMEKGIDYALKLFDNIILFSKYYKFIKNNEWINFTFMNEQMNSLIEGIDTYIQLILNIIINNSYINEDGKISFSEEHKKEIQISLNIIECYKFRRYFMGMNDKTITRYIPSIKPNEFEKNFPYSHKLYYLIYYLPNHSDKVLSYRMPTNDEFKIAMCNNDAYYTVKTCKNFLIRIANFSCKEKYNYEKMSIEHIFPQNESEWKFDKEEIERMINLRQTIGNLTLTSYNPELSNKNFITKKNKLLNFDNFVLNKYFLELNDWKSNDIHDRSLFLYNKTLEIWNFNKIENDIKENIVTYNKFFENVQLNIEDDEEEYYVNESDDRLKDIMINRSSFIKIKEQIDYDNVVKVLRNYLVEGVSQVKNEVDVFNKSFDGWVSMSVYRYFGLDSSKMKKNMNINQFNDFIERNVSEINSLLNIIHNF